MAFYVRGAAIENAKGYELRKKVTSDGETTYPLVDSKKAGMVYFNEVGGLGADGWENSDTDCIHTPFIAIEDLEDSYIRDPDTYATLGCVSTPYFEGAQTSWTPMDGDRTNPIFFALYEKADYSSYIPGTLTYPEDVGDDGFSTFLSDIKSTYTWDDRAKYIVFSVKKTSPEVNENGMFVNLRKDISFRLDDYPDTLPAGQTHQLVVKAIGEGGEDLDGDGVIYADSEYGGDADGEPLVYAPAKDAGIVGTKHTVFYFDNTTENGTNLSAMGTVSGGKLTTSGKPQNGVALTDAITLTKGESFTIEFVSNFYNATNGNGLIIGGGTQDGGGSFVYLCWMDSLKCLRLRDSANLVQVDGTLTNLSSATETAHFAIVYDATTQTIKMYQNYEEVTVAFTKGSSMATFADTVLNTMCGGYTDQFIYQGILEYFKYTNKALSVAEFHRE